MYLESKPVLTNRLTLAFIATIWIFGRLSVSATLSFGNRTQVRCTTAFFLFLCVGKDLIFLDVVSRFLYY